MQDIDELREFIDDSPTLGQHLYIAEDRKVYQMGIIDPLTNFGTKKNLEYTFKRCRYGKQMSCIPPKQYGPRFVNFMHEIFEEEENAAQTSNF